VNVRGFRIEPGEIESVVNNHPDVRECAVVLQGESLTACVVRKTGSRVTSADLRTFLKRRLPHFMIPSFYAFLDELPLTPAGKIDRKALSASDAMRSAQDIVPPRTPEEKILSEIWEKVFGIEPIGINDNFFDLGGHSLTGMRIISLLRNILRVELPLRALLERPTISELSALIVEREGGRAQQDARVLRRITGEEGRG
jgi:acyl carrier protein